MSQRRLLKIHIKKLKVNNTTARELQGTVTRPSAHARARGVHLRGKLFYVETIKNNSECEKNFELVKFERLLVKTKFVLLAPNIWQKTEASEFYCFIKQV